MIRINKSSLAIAYEKADEYVNTKVDYLVRDIPLHKSWVHTAYVAGRLEAVADYDAMIEYCNKVVTENNELKEKIKRLENGN